MPHLEFVRYVVILISLFVRDRIGHQTTINNNIQCINIVRALCIDYDQTLPKTPFFYYTYIHTNFSRCGTEPNSRLAVAKDHEKLTDLADYIREIDPTDNSFYWIGNKSNLSETDRLQLLIHS